MKWEIGGGRKVKGGKEEERGKEDWGGENGNHPLRKLKCKCTSLQNATDAHAIQTTEKQSQRVFQKTMAPHKGQRNIRERTIWCESSRTNQQRHLRSGPAHSQSPVLSKSRAWPLVRKRVAGKKESFHNPRVKG
jgi:hypothetical protein